MAKGKVFWENKELRVKWEITKAGQTKWGKSTPVRDANVRRTMEQMQGVQEASVEVELVQGTAGKITFVNEEIAEKVEENQQEIARTKELQIQKAQENDALEQKANSNRPKSDFHNPYNFVPAIPRGSVTGELADGEPIGHDTFYSNHLSGKLKVIMTVKTPLVVLDTARMSLNANEKTHKEFPVRIKPLMDEDGNIVMNRNGQIVTVPDINPTAIKGMLRSAYEAVTNSRMSIFSETERLAFRMGATPEETKEVFPAIIIKNGTESKVRILANKINDQKQVARLKRYEQNGDERYALTHNSNGEKPEHKEVVWVQIDRTNQYAWSVTEIDNTPKTGGGWEKGWVYISGANIKNKKYERVFLNYMTGQTDNLGDLEKDWEDLIANYRKTHEKALQKREQDGNKAWDYLGDNPGDTAWSRQIYDEDCLKLENGTLCYALREDGQIKALLPVIISRRIFPKTPISLLPKELHPAKLITQLSPADRVFGWVRQRKPKAEELTADERNLPKEVKEIGAYRGQIRFDEVTTQRTDAIQEFSDWLPMNILGQPKPQQGRFYVAKDKDGNAQIDGLNNENAGYNLPSVKGLRGRKVYPHHANLPKDYWFERKEIDFEDTSLTQQVVDSAKPRFFREYLRPPFSNKQRDSQNRSIEGWVKPQTEFQFDIYFTNLSEVELGALIWLLQMNEGLAEDKYFHRFGGGKPLGFGSVKLELRETESDIRTGKELAEQRYDSLAEDTPKCENVKTNFVDKFEKAIESAEYQNILESFKVACKGFDDKLPIHYPRARRYDEVKDKDDYRKITDIKYIARNNTNEYLPPHADGKSFEWFVENAKEKNGLKANNGSGRVLIEEIRPRFILDNLWGKKLENGKEIGKEDMGLPILPHKKT